MNHLHKAFRSEENTKIFVSINPDRLNNPALIGDPLIMGDLQGGRIPSLILAKSKKEKESVLLAISDVGNEGADWGKVDIGIRRSFDGGDSWSAPIDKVLGLITHRAPQDFHDWQSAFYIDAVTTQAQNGDIVMLVDMWPECKGLHAADYLETGTGYEWIDGKCYRILYSGESKVGNGHTNHLGEKYTIREEGWVYDDKGVRTRYYVPQYHSPENGFITMGDMYYAVGEGQYLKVCPPLMPSYPDENNKELQDIYVGNIYLSYEKPAFNPEHPVFVQKRFVGPSDSGEKYDGPSLYETYESEPAPLRAVVTSYLWVSRSHDQGETWSQPYDITPYVKVEQDQAFLGTGPGVGITLQYQKDSSKNGRILMPVYALGKATAIYSDDEGYTFKRAKNNGQFYINTIDETQFVELLNGDILAFGRQVEKGKTPLSISKDGGETWSEQMEDDLISVRCQKSIITYPVHEFPYSEGMKEGKQYVLAAHPSGNAPLDASRTNGVVSLGEVQENSTIKWIAQRSLNLTPNPYEDTKGYERFFGYSSMAVLEDGCIGILFEPQPNNFIAYAKFNLAWILEEDK